MQSAWGVPVLKDRVVQMATLLILEPIFEADFEDCSYGFRPKRSTHDALEQIQRGIKEGLSAIYDADLKGYFDSIPHDKLMACVEMRVADRSVLQLIRMWLKAPIVEMQNGKRMPPKSNDKGTPQGGVISPLLANLYLHWFDRKFHRKDGPGEWAKARLIRYADDFVVLARYQGERLRNWIEGQLEGWLGLQMNREKTKTVQLKEEGATLTFLGYTFRYALDLHGRGHRYLTMHPSLKAMEREREKIREMTSARYSYVPARHLIKTLNAHLKGWKGYYKMGHCRHQFRQINYLAMQFTLVLFRCTFDVCKSIRKRLSSSENDLPRSRHVRTTLERCAGRTGLSAHNVSRSERGKCGEVSTGAATATTSRLSRRALCSMIRTSRYDFGLRLCGM